MQPVNANELLRTKLALPHLRASYVSRQHLLSKLDAGLERSLTLLSAPAGFGKTTLLAEWITSAQADDQRLPAWLSLDEGDNDLIRFWGYVIAAFQTIHPSVGASTLALLYSQEPPALESVVATFINDIASLPRKWLLVLEDYHVIASSSVHKSIIFLLEHLPASLHIVISTRSDPPLPLARLRARNDMIELRAADLRFSPAETTIFLNEISGCHLSASDIKQLEMHTEGWIAALHLISLLLAGKRDVVPFITTFTGSHRHVSEYLVEEVLSNQPPYIQTFLLQTSILSRLNGSLCDAVTGRSDSELLLEDLERANLFLLPLDETREWYRYHALFAEAIRHHARRRLGPAQVHSLYRKASLWYEQYGLFNDAIEAALSAQEFERAASLIERRAEATGIYYKYTLRRWIEQLPRPLLYTYPLLCFTYAQILFFSLFATDQREAYLVPLQIAEDLWRTEGNLHQVGAILALRALAACWSDDIAHMLEFAEQALQMLPQGENVWRSVSLGMIGKGYLLLGDANKAWQPFLEAFSRSEKSENRIVTLPLLNSLAEVAILQGKLRQAAQFYQQVVEDAGQMFDDRSKAHLGLSALYLEWNDLKEAEAHVLQGMLDEEQAGDSLRESYSHIVWMRVKKALGEREQAHQILLRMIEEAEQKKSSIALETLQAYQVLESLAVGDLDAVMRWRNTCAPSLENAQPYVREQAHLVLARVLIVQGEPGEALCLLKRCQAEAQASGRTNSEIEIIALNALAYYAQGEMVMALQTITQALSLAQSERYMRLFLDEGVAMAALLRSVRAKTGEPSLVEYIDALLAAFEKASLSPTPLLPPPIPTALMEPLSQHEYRVLRLLVAGLSNPEIANELMISINTVKTHVKNIYGKLNVTSRREAKENARRLKLL